MKPDKLSVFEIFEKQRRYVVPLYQRSYVWTQEEQWEPLWEDIARQAEHCLADQYGQVSKTHFLGAVVLNVISIVGRNVPRSEVIDGQQRLTTFQILLAALRDFAETEECKIAEDFGRLTANPVREEGSEEVFKVWPTNSDRANFAKVMTAKSPDGVRAAFDAAEGPLPRMAEAYLYFYSAIETFVEEHEGLGAPEQCLDAIFQALRVALQIIVIELEPSDDPQVIFETLNARGQPLLPSDLIRNFIFLQASTDPSSNVDRLYDCYWRQFDELRLPSPNAEGEDRFWHVMERQGRLRRPRIDLFIFHYLVLKTKTDLNIGRLFREFREWRNDTKTSAEEFLSELNDYSKHFKALVEPVGDTRLANFSRRLKSLDTSIVYPTLLFLTSCTPDQLPDEELDRCLVNLESWLVRRYICQYTNKNYNRFFLALLVKLASASDRNQSIADALRDELLRSKEPTAVWPSNDEFEKGWLTKPIYVKSRVDRCGMVLRALEDDMHTAKTESLKKDNLTVEHILPQKGAIEEYPYAAEMPSIDGETDERTRLRIIHTIGNLTLLTQALNSSVSNGPYPEKRSEITEHSDLRMNAWMRTDEREGWSEDDIVERGSRLFAHAKKIWPIPDSIEGELATNSDRRG